MIRKPYRHLLTRCLGIIFCLFFLSSCSTKLAYNYLDIVLKWYTGQYVSLDKTQKKLWSKKIKAFHTWHRETQLPLYANYVDGAIERIKSTKIDGSFIHNETDEVQLLVDPAISFLKPSIAELISTFDEKQAQEILENFTKEREEYHKDYILPSDEKKYKRRANEIKDKIGPFFGRLTKEQKGWIDEWARALSPYEELTLKQQEIWAKKLEQALELKDDEQALLAILDDVMFYRTDDWDPELEKILDHNQDITYELLAKLVNGQTEKQRKKMFKKLKNYQNDFIELSQNR